MLLNDLKNRIKDKNSKIITLTSSNEKLDILEKEFKNIFQEKKEDTIITIWEPNV